MELIPPQMDSTSPDTGDSFTHETGICSWSIFSYFFSIFSCLGSYEIVPLSFY